MAGHGKILIFFSISLELTDFTLFITPSSEPTTRCSCHFMITFTEPRTSLLIHYVKASLKKLEDSPDVVHLTHLTTPDSIYHQRLGFLSVASKPHMSKWYLLIMWPSHVAPWQWLPYAAVHSFQRGISFKISNYSHGHYQYIIDKYI